jgi:branched-chain amino acid transport system ATP-binding protein
LSISDKGYVLETGKIVMSDTGVNLTKNPRVIASYLGGAQAKES